MRLALAAVAALAIAAAGCGGVESEPNLAQAAESTEASDSFAFEVTSHAAGGESFSGTCKGVVDNVREVARVSCDSDSASSFGGFDMIIVDDASYRKDRGKQKWMKEPDSLDEFSPSLILGLLRTASQKTERVGEEQIRGESTVQYALTVDCEQAELYDCTGGTAVVDVWIDDNGLVRRISVAETATGVDLEFFDFGVLVDTQAPPPEQVDERPRPAPASCTTQSAGPIEVREAIDALRRHGFDVDPLALGCYEGVAGYLGTRAGATAELIGSAGYLTCIVFAEDSPPEIGVLLPEIAVGSVSLPAPQQRTVENLECSLYVEGPRAEARVQALEAVLQELKR